MNGKRTLAAIMFTDMVGYTALMQKDEILARRKRDRHREVLEELHGKHSGRIIQYFGDGTLSIFDSSVQAVQCAIEIQQQLKAPIEVPLRIGIHSGDIVLEEDNIVGDAANLASRIESFSVPGAVLISDVVYGQIKNQPQFQLRSLGKFQLKNVDRPFEIFALANEGLIAPDPQDLTGKGARLAIPKNNLPKVTTSFLGREKEIAEVGKLLKDRRLITLTGPGGTGKTRLSIQIARQVAEQFPGGLYWVPLASIREADKVAFAIAKELGLKEDVFLSIEEVLVRFFQDKNALLILDNFEQIIAAASVVEQLFQSCENLCILVNSRIVLQVAGEEEYQVPPLSLPRLSGASSLERLREVPSIALFTQRARSNRRKFQLTPDNVEAVAQICIRLDGLPLAIELAAARTKIFKPSALLRRLNKRLDVLKGGGRYPERHQTLRQTIAWSYDLLEAEEQELFRRTSVFVGGSTMEALETVCGQNGLADWDVVDGVMALVDKSLLQTEETEDDLRFYMLETIREFAAEALEESRRNIALKKAHINYYLALAEEAAPQLYGSKAGYWSDILFREQANFREAINYAIQIGELALAYRFGASLWLFWGSKGMLNDGIEQLEKLLAVPAPESLREKRLQVSQALAMQFMHIPLPKKAFPLFEENLNYWRQKKENPKQLGIAINNYVWCTSSLGAYRKSRSLAFEAKHILEQIDAKTPLIASLNGLGYIYMFLYKFKEAIAYFSQNLELTRHMQDHRRHAYAMLNLGYCYFQKGDYETAERQLRQAMNFFRQNAYKPLESFANLMFGFFKYAKGDFADLLAISRNLERIGKEINSLIMISGASEIQALLAWREGDLQEAKRLIEKSFAFFKNKQGVTYWMKGKWIVRANIALDQGDVELVKKSCRELLDGEIEEDSYRGFIPGLEISARLAALENSYEAAAQLFFNAQALRSELGVPILKSEQSIYDAFLADIKNNLSEKAYILAQEQRLENEDLFALANRVIKLEL